MQTRNLDNLGRPTMLRWTPPMMRLLRWDWPPHQLKHLEGHNLQTSVKGFIRQNIKLNIPGSETALIVTLSAFLATNPNSPASDPRIRHIVKVHSAIINRDGAA